jgi:hypothetical protein
MDPLVAATVALGGVIIGATLTAALEEWRSRSGEKRASKRAIGDRVAAWHLDRLRQTRRQLDGTVTELEAMASGNLKDFRRGQAMSRRNPDGNTALLGDVALVREVHDLLVFLNKRAGKGLEPDDQIRRIDLMGRVAIALDAQEQRVLQGEPPLQVAKDDAPELFDAYQIAERMDAYAVPASTTVRLAMSLLRRFLRRRVGTG